MTSKTRKAQQRISAIVYAAAGLLLFFLIFSLVLKVQQQLSPGAAINMPSTGAVLAVIAQQGSFLFVIFAFAMVLLILFSRRLWR